VPEPTDIHQLQFVWLGLDQGNVTSAVGGSQTGYVVRPRVECNIGGKQLRCTPILMDTFCLHFKDEPDIRSPPGGPRSMQHAPPSDSVSSSDSKLGKHEDDILN
jgi:hypothetical protein